MNGREQHLTRTLGQHVLELLLPAPSPFPLNPVLSPVLSQRVPRLQIRLTIVLMTRASQNLQSTTCIPYLHSTTCLEAPTNGCAQARPSHLANTTHCCPQDCLHFVLDCRQPATPMHLEKAPPTQAVVVAQLLCFESLIWSVALTILQAQVLAAGPIGAPGTMLPLAASCHPVALGAMGAPGSHHSTPTAGLNLQRPHPVPRFTCCSTAHMYPRCCNARQASPASATRLQVHPCLVQTPVLCQRFPKQTPGLLAHSTHALA